MPRTGQALRGSRRPSLLYREAIVLAPKARERLLRGLERFANTGDTEAEYKAFAKGWPSFWPRTLHDETRRRIPAWSDAHRELFLRYRDTLRRVWISDPDALKRHAVGFLLGIGAEFQDIEHGAEVQIPGLSEAWQKFRTDHPAATVTSRAVVYPDWRAGHFTYLPENEFQQAFYILFAEHWRAKLCARCSTYFVAQKAAQLYCSVKCSNTAHQFNALKWWREKGTQMRAMKTSAPHKGRDRGPHSDL